MTAILKKALNFVLELKSKKLFTYDSVTTKKGNEISF
jgi:hypothetical protein